MAKIIAIILLIIIIVKVILPILGFMFAWIFKVIVFCLAVYLCIDLYFFITKGK